MFKITFADCIDFLKNSQSSSFDLTFLDPPFNQGKQYENHNDNMGDSKYWDWMQQVCGLVYRATTPGGGIYFMQREKHTCNIHRALESTGWNYQNQIIWKKKASAVPNKHRYGLHYQVIVFYTKGLRPRVFNKLRIDPPLLVTEKYQRPNGMFVTDVWDDIRELTSGYYAGDEPLRDADGKRFHHQQSPLHLLLRIILSSTKPGDTVFDPFAGTGTSLIVANQLQRQCICVDNSMTNCDEMCNRLIQQRNIDDISRLRDYYRFTEDLDSIWPVRNEQVFREINQVHIPAQALFSDPE